MDLNKNTKPPVIPVNEDGSILIPRIIPRSDDPPKDDHKKADGHFKKRKKIKPWVKAMTAVATVLLVFIVITSILAFSVYRKALVLKDSLKSLKDSVSSQDIQKIRTELPKVESSFNGFNRSYRLLGYLKIVPFVGNYYSDGNHALNAASYSLTAGSTLLDTIEPFADIIGFGGGSGNAVSADQNAQQRIDFVIKAIPSLVPKMDELSKNALAIKNELDLIDPARYPAKYKNYEVRSTIKNVIDQVDQAYLLIENAKPILQAAPYILGTDGTRQYLVLFQNDKELRPTGGFITAYTVAKVTNGRFEPGVSDDIYNLDNKYKPNIKAPDPIVKYLKAPYTTSPYFRLRDINWNPDFSDSMKIFLKEARTAGVPDVDGIIAVDTQVLVNLLDVIGPIGVPGFGDFSTKIVPECNCPQVIYELESFADVEGAVVWSENEPGKIVFAPPNYQNRKKIIGPLMNSILANTLGQPKDKIPALFDAMFRSLTEKHILFYFTDDKTQKAASEFGIAGTFKDAKSSDFLAIVDANLGGRKSNLYLTQDVAQELETDKTGNIIKTLTITYKNTEKQDGWLNSIMPNWVRVYVPKGSELISFDGVETKIPSYEEYNKTVYAGSFELRPLGVSKVTLKYKLPMKFKDYYVEYIQKQPGKNSNLFTFSIGKLEEEHVITTDKEIRIKI
jgi:hypothetical protein